MTDPATQPFSSDQVDPQACLLRQMLDALVAHRQAKAHHETEDKIIGLDFGLVIKPQPPRWIQEMKAAGQDGIERSLLASIREEGWRAYAEGGLHAMRELADRACGDNGLLLSILDHHWDGIGTDSRGHWVC